MTLTSRHLRSAAEPSTPSREFEKLRSAFQLRLVRERANLENLAAALTRADGGSALAFEQLRFSAHRLHGAAAVFETFEVADAASALENASALAWSANADKSDVAVSTALRGLIDLLAQVIGERPVITP
jgi:HPt (histidine-containing phosphotransfer) domain-containing protein